MENKLLEELDKLVIDHPISDQMRGYNHAILDIKQILNKIVAELIIDEEE